jgi:formylglycine-generating enzyme required for sulfatase activity
MKTKLHRLIAALVLLALSTLNPQLSTCFAQGTAFTYQGWLMDGGNPANGSYDLSFSLYTVSSDGAVAAGPVTFSATGVTNGLFTVTLDFGAVFNGGAYWLDIAARTNGGGAFTELSPRQPLTPTPYSIYSGQAAYATTANGVAGGVIGPNAFQVGAGPTTGQVLSYNGSILAWTSVGGGGGGSGWSLTGNSGTIPGTDFLGTKDNQPLELWVNNTRAFRLEPGAGGSPNVVGGSSSSADGTANGGTIAGGIGNTVSHIYPTVSGGELNHATANGAVVGGGYNNTANGGQATVVGGVQNTASGIGAFIGGGGYDGTTQAGNSAGGAAAVVGGGLANSAGNSYDTVPGGSYNIASGGNSFAAGHQAQALHNGAFVWADATGGAFQSTAPDQFSVRAEGGVRFVTAGGGMTVDGVAVGSVPGTVVTNTETGVTLSGTFSGNGAGLTNLPASTVLPPGMVLIPAGAFTMGNSIGDGDISDATPISVTLSAFYMDVNLVSYSQWQSVYFWAINNGYAFFQQTSYQGSYAASGKAANNPVQTVDWCDVVKWSNARSQQAGLTPVYYTDAGFTQIFTNGDYGTTVYANWGANGYRLPTEAEWEKAARGGVHGQRFPWGNLITENLANYQSSAGGYDLGPSGYNSIGSVGGTSPATSPVGSFAANGYGLYDMAGNVFEWCWDWYGTSYAGGTDPRGPAYSPQGDRVFRGGGWLNVGSGASDSRCAARGGDDPRRAIFWLGFRCVRGH